MIFTADNDTYENLSGVSVYNIWIPPIEIDKQE